MDGARMSMRRLEGASCSTAYAVGCRQRHACSMIEAGELTSHYGLSAGPFRRRVNSKAAQESFQIEGEECYTRNRELPMHGLYMHENAHVCVSACTVITPVQLRLLPRLRTQSVVSASS